MKWFRAVGIVFMLVGSLIKEGFQRIIGSKPDKPGEPTQAEVDCSGCKGTGKVTYGPDHYLVKEFNQPPGTYSCPYCDGIGKIIEEIR